MCTRPITQDEKTFSCRTCDECIATRRHGWVSRAMAEKACHSHAACVTLTYSDATQEGRDGARMFAYADVRLFLGRLREAARYEAKRAGWNQAPYVRFLCAGEQGDRNGRCHWHLILYTNFDLSLLGKFRLSGKLVSHRRDMLTVGKRKRRLNWTLWPAGFMTLQEPDEAGMAYVLSYCLKDQFTAEKAKDTMREASSENFATGLFRMSKRPAIGEQWLYEKLETLLASGSVLPSVQLKIPEMSGYWHPTGPFMVRLLWGLVAVNNRILWTTGAPAPQWSSLLASCADIPPYMEILTGVPEKIEDDTAGDLERRARFDQGERKTRETRRKCGSGVPCFVCLNSASSSELRAHGFGRAEGQNGLWRYFSLEGFPHIDKRRKDGGREHPLCQSSGSKENRRAFPRSGAKTAR